MMAGDGVSCTDPLLVKDRTYEMRMLVLRENILVGRNPLECCAASIVHPMRQGRDHPNLG